MNATLTAIDRCDYSQSEQAAVIYTMQPRGKHSKPLELALCSHHANLHAKRLTAAGWKKENTA